MLEETADGIASDMYRQMAGLIDCCCIYRLM